MGNRVVKLSGRVSRRNILFADAFELITAIKLLGFNHMLQIKKAKTLADKTLVGFFVTRVMNTLLNVGFFSEFSKKEVIDINLFSKERGLDKRILCLLCDYLHTLKILEKRIVGYRLTTKGRLIVEKLGGVFDIIYSFEDIFHNLEPLLKKEKIVGKDVVLRTDFEAKGTGAAAKFLPFPIMMDIINRGNFRNVFDIGCGSATFLIELCKSNPAITGYGVDISRDALLYGQRQLAENNLQDRITLFEGDVLNDFETITDKFNNADIVTASFMLHELFFEKEEKLIHFLIKLRCRYKNKPLMICENIKQTLQELRKEPGLYSELQLAHGIARERQMARKDWKEVFRKSGFREAKERYLSFAKIGIYIVR